MKKINSLQNKSKDLFVRLFVAFFVCVSVVSLSSCSLLGPNVKKKHPVKVSLKNGQVIRNCYASVPASGSPIKLFKKKGSKYTASETYGLAEIKYVEFGIEGKPSIKRRLYSLPISGGGGKSRSWMIESCKGEDIRCLMSSDQYIFDRDGDFTLYSTGSEGFPAKIAVYLQKNGDKAFFIGFNGNSFIFRDSKMRDAMLEYLKDDKDLCEKIKSERMGYKDICDIVKEYRGKIVEEYYVNPYESDPDTDSDDKETEESDDKTFSSTLNQSYLYNISADFGFVREQPTYIYVSRVRIPYKFFNYRYYGGLGLVKEFTKDHYDRKERVESKLSFVVGGMLAGQLPFKLSDDKILNAYLGYFGSIVLDYNYYARHGVQLGADFYMSLPSGSYIGFGPTLRYNIHNNLTDKDFSREKGPMINNFLSLGVNVSFVF